MARVVSDAGPLIHLAQAKVLHLVQMVFGSLSITAGVRREALDEGVRLHYEDAQIIGKGIEEGWIIIEVVAESVFSAAKKLAEGENISQTDAETLLIAKEKAAEILVDEKILSDLAKMYGLKVWNTWTILLESLKRGFITVHEVESAITELGEKRHKLTGNQAEEILRAARLISSRKER